MKNILLEHTVYSNLKDIALNDLEINIENIWMGNNLLVHAKIQSILNDLNILITISMYIKILIVFFT